MPTNGNVAPVCPISRSQVASGMPGVRIPVIPTATDLPSLIAAVNTINLLVQQLLGPGRVTNNVYPPNMPLSPSGGSSPVSHGGAAAYFLGQPEWAEKHRSTQHINSFHKDFSGSSQKGSVSVKEDPDQYVNVMRINTITFQNTNYGDADFLWQYHTP
jgi:hypothetical protein